jgi:hypothetical protein
MLPGFRFLVAAIVFSLSVLVFGLGAVTLFRAAHEQFASNSSWRATPTTSFSTFLPPPESSAPTLALLRVEPIPAQGLPAPMRVEIQTDAAPIAASADDRELTDTTPVTADIASAAPDVTAASSAAPPGETMVPAPTVVAVSPAVASPDLGRIEMAELQSTRADTTAGTASANPDTTKQNSIKPEIATPDSPMTIGISPERREAPTVTVAEAPILARTDVVTSDSPSPSLPAMASTTAPRSDVIAVKLASLGDQPVASERNASIRIASVRLHQSLAKKRLAKERLAKERLAQQARRAKQQRQMAQRARASQQAAFAQPQQPNYADPFAQQPAFGQQTAQRGR